jgi:hypothetical protein
MRTCTGDEPDGIIAVLCILPEMDIGVVEDISPHAQIVEALGGEDHAHIVAGVKQRQRLQEKVRVCHLHHPAPVLNLCRSSTVKRTHTIQPNLPGDDQQRNKPSCKTHLQQD